MPAPRQPKRTVGSVIGELIKRTNTDMRRLRILEQKSDIFKTRISSLEESMLNYKKLIQKDISTINSKIAKQEERIIQIENMIKEIVKQLKRVATKSDIGGLEQLISIYNPIKSKFVTREEVKQLIEESKERD